MARYGQGHAAETHTRIVGQAARMIRERGLDKASVAEVMKAAGLTVGGFYAQFPDKDAMLAEAVAAAFEDTQSRLAFLAAKAAEVGDAGIIPRFYLSDDRVANLPGGCAAAALASEMHRAAPPVREAFEAGAKEAAGRLGPLFDESGEAWAPLALLIGALALMRAVPDRQTADALREAAVAAFRALAAAPRRSPDERQPGADGR